MEIPAVLCSDLAILSAALNDNTDIESSLDALLLDLQIAVKSFLGLIVTLVIDGYPAIFNALPDAADRPPIGATIRLPLPVVSGAEPGSNIVVFAATPGAFIDLAADLSYALHVNPDTLVLDADLHPTTAPIGMAAVTDINQAIGILIERGRVSTGAARTELNRLAEHTNSTIHAAAQLLIASILLGPPDPGAPNT